MAFILLDDGGYAGIATNLQFNFINGWMDCHHYGSTLFIAVNEANDSLEGWAAPHTKLAFAKDDFIITKQGGDRCYRISLVAPLSTTEGPLTTTFPPTTTEEPPPTTTEAPPPTTTSEPTTTSTVEPTTTTTTTPAQHGCCRDCLCNNTGEAEDYYQCHIETKPRCVTSMGACYYKLDYEGPPPADCTGCWPNDNSMQYKYIWDHDNCFP